MSNLKQDLDKLHEQACKDGQKSFIIPGTNTHVFTQLAHLERGKCCSSGCRYCPWKHFDVKSQ